MLKMRHLKIASSLRFFMPYGYRNDWFFRDSLTGHLIDLTMPAGYRVSG